jgi:methionine synthase II (cobalamin-independent)
MTVREGTESYLLRFPPGLKIRAESAARSDGRTLNNWLVNLINREVSAVARTVEIHIELTDVTEGWHTVDGIDVEETNYSFARKLEDAIKAKYPSSSVKVSVQPNVYGSTRTIIDANGYDEEQEIDEDINHISEKLYENSESWIVLAK